MAKKRKAEPTFSQEQPFDSSFKMLLDDQLLAFLSYLLGVVIAEAYELKESLFKRGLLKPSLRVDALYRVRNAGQSTFYLVHIECETEPVREEMEKRLIQYFGLLFAKYYQVIVQVLLSPFKAENLPEPIFSLQHEGRELVKHEFIVVAFSQHQAQELLDRQLVELYALMPTMAGATYERLMQALEAMEAFYEGQADRFRNHLLWFDAFLGRTATVSQSDKERIRREVGKHKSLLEEGFFFQQATQEARAKGLAEGRQEGLQEGEVKGLQEGELKGLQEAIMTFIVLRFPGLANLAQQQVPLITQRETLDRLIKEISVAFDEATVRSLLEPHQTA